MPKVNPQPLITLIGPTASGKSALGLALARTFNGVILSADSRQLYQHARIGTNQPACHWQAPNKKWRKIFGSKKLYMAGSIPHFFIDTLSPDKTYSAAQYQLQVNKLLKKLIPFHILPILVGGTGLYVSSIVETYEFPTSKPSLKLRKKLEKLSLAKLASQLKEFDLATWRTIDIHNRRRLIRALEHVLATGTSFAVAKARSFRPHTLVLGLNPSAIKLRTIIQQRTAKMLRAGLVSEFKFIKNKFPNSPLLNSIGYRELIPTLTDQESVQTAAQKISTHTWQYARRQMTWFKRMPQVYWVKNTSQAERLIKKFLRQNKNPSRTD